MEIQSEETDILIYLTAHVHEIDDLNRFDRESLDNYLVWSTRRDYNRLAKWLVEHGCDINQRSVLDDMTALDIAIERNNHMLANLLKRFGAVSREMVIARRRAEEIAEEMGCYEDLDDDQWTVGAFRIARQIKRT